MDKKHPKAKCEECPLASKGRYVPSTIPETVRNGEGDVNYGKRIAFVGESPGKQEVYKGKVFIGPSGQVLDAVMVEHGIDRGATFLGNAIACHYSETDFAKPPKEAVEACRGRLISELTENKIDTVITVGAVAATALIDTKVGITRLRAGGPRLASYARDDGELLTVIPTFHPAAALRDQSKFPYIVMDIAKVKGDGVWGSWVDPKYTVVDNVAIATKWINKLIDSEFRGPLVVDTESGADKDEVFGGDINEVLCIGVWYEDDSIVVVFTALSLDKFNRRLLGNLFVERGIVAQNGKYDVTRCLNSYLGSGFNGVGSYGDSVVLDIPVEFDTMLASYCLDEGKGVHGLGYMQTEYLGTPDYKNWIDESIDRTKARMRADRKAAKLPMRGLFAPGKDYSLVEPDVLYKYNAWDVYGTRLLQDKFSGDLVDGKVDRLHSWLIGIGGMLAHVETNGLAVDIDYNLALEVEYKEMLSQVEFGKDAEDINPRSWQQVKAFLEVMGVKVDSTDKTTLLGLIERYAALGRDDIVDFCQSLLDHRGASKLMSTYVTGLRKNLVNGVAHPSFLLHGTTTGRLSCRNPNLQNIPRPSGMRRQFVPSSSHRIFVQADYAQNELRCMTWFGKDEMMRKVFNDGTQDVFELLCAEMYGSRFINASKPVRKEMRTLIKTMAYGIAYGREAKAIALAFNISVREATQRMKTFTDMIPGIMKFQQGIKDKVMRGEDLVNPFGRRRRFHLITNANVVTVFNEATAFMPQATGSDICLEAAYRLDKQGVQIRNLVHDSIMAECDKSEVREVSHLLSTTMVETAELITEGYVKFAVDVETGTSWGDF